MDSTRGPLLYTQRPGHLYHTRFSSDSLQCHTHLDQLPKFQQPISVGVQGYQVRLHTSQLLRPQAWHQAREEAVEVTRAQRTAAAGVERLKRRQGSSLRVSYAY
jgi:hypothetical protein